MNVQIPHFSFPFSQNGSSFTVSEQGSSEEIQDCIVVLLLTPVGGREVFPAYGSPEVLGQQVPLNLPLIVNACNMWEPRATAFLNEVLDNLDEKITHLKLNISGGTS